MDNLLFMTVNSPDFSGFLFHQKCQNRILELTFDPKLNRIQKTVPWTKTTNSRTPELKNPIKKTEGSKNNLWISPFLAATLSTAALVGIDLATPCTPVYTSHRELFLECTGHGPNNYKNTKP
jgi:hypothetical protein